MNPACALDLFWQVDRRLRLYVLSRFLADGGTVHRILEGEAVSPTGAEAAGLGSGLDRQSRIMVIADNIARGRIDQARMDLAPLAGISMATSKRIVFDRGGEAIAVAVKAAGATRSTFASITEMWAASDRPVVDDPASLPELLVLFERLSRGQAVMAMTYWDWRESASGPYAGQEKPVHSVDES
jgi:hypothetical protein